MTNLTPTRKEDVSTTEIEKFQFQNVPSTDEGGLIINTEVRVVSIDGEPWFVAKDVTDILGFKDSVNAIKQHVLPGQSTVVDCHLGGPNPRRTVINESGLYRLIMRSNVPAAAKFQAWVTDEVLPTIRKTGAYVDPNTELANKIAGRRCRGHDGRLRQDAPDRQGGPGQGPGAGGQGRGGQALRRGVEGVLRHGGAVLAA
ncbi:antirepressor [Mycobacterium phage McFly]|nr:antirepressor [Mycobacterium phage McFly]